MVQSSFVVNDVVSLHPLLQPYLTHFYQASAYE